MYACVQGHACTQTVCRWWRRTGFCVRTPGARVLWFTEECVCMGLPWVCVWGVCEGETSPVQGIGLGVPAFVQGVCPCVWGCLWRGACAPAAQPRRVTCVPGQRLRWAMATKPGAGLSPGRPGSLGLPPSPRPPAAPPLLSDRVGGKGQAAGRGNRPGGGVEADGAELRRGPLRRGTRGEPHDTASQAPSPLTQPPGLPRPSHNPSPLSRRHVIVLALLKGWGRPPTPCLCEAATRFLPCRCQNRYFLRSFKAAALYELVRNEIKCWLGTFWGDLGYPGGLACTSAAVRPRCRPRVWQLREEDESSPSPPAATHST